MPPVTSTVPVGSQSRSGTGAGAGARRLPNVADERTATSFSPFAAASTPGSRDAESPSSVRGRSTRPPQRSGYSAAATRPRPQTAACAGSGTVSSAAPTVTAPLVAHHSGAPIPASPIACSSATVSSTPVGVSADAVSSRASSETTPPNRPSTERSSSAIAARSGPATSTATTSVPSAASTPDTHSSARRPVGTTASHGPDGPAAERPDSGRQTIRWRHPSTTDREWCAARQSSSAGMTSDSASRRTSRMLPRDSMSSSRTAAQNRSSSGAAVPRTGAGSAEDQNLWCWNG